MARSRIAAARLAAAAFLILASFTQNAHGAARDESRAELELVGETTRTVRFVAGDGRAVVVVRNLSHRSGRLELVYIARSGGRVIALSSRPRPAPGEVHVRALQGLRRPLAAGRMRQIELRLHLARDAAPADGSGVVEVRLAASDAPPVAMTIRGAAADVAFDPARLTIDVSQGCWLFGRVCGDTQKVLLRGRDAVLWARSPHPTRPEVILNNDHGGAVSVQLSDVEVERGIVSATVDASDLNEAGAYEGKLPIEPSGLAGPSLLVTVKVRWALATAVFVIFLGALFGGFFLRRFEIRRRRRLLELELLSALGRYDEELALSEGTLASFDVGRLLEPRRQDDKAATLPYPGTRGVSALLWHIKTARDDADFSEDIAHTHALIATIERWLALEPVAREAARIVDDEAPPPRMGTPLSDTRAYQDLAYLRISATTAPASDAKCEELIAALTSQGRVAVKCRVIWELLTELEVQSGYRLAQAQAIAELDVLALEPEFPPFALRTPDETDQLLVALDRAEEGLQRLFSDVSRLVEPAYVSETRRIERRLEQPAAPPKIERKMLDLSPWRLRLAGAFSALALRSIAWTLARALVAAGAYALVIYSDTWGSVTDFASAFTAGFLTETIVNWAVLPAFVSNRNRSASRLPSADSEQSPQRVAPPQPADRPTAVEPSADPARAPEQPGAAAAPAATAPGNRVRT